MVLLLVPLPSVVPVAILHAATVVARCWSLCSTSIQNRNKINFYPRWVIFKDIIERNCIKEVLFLWLISHKYKNKGLVWVMRMKIRDHSIIKKKALSIKMRDKTDSFLLFRFAQSVCYTWWWFMEWYFCWFLCLQSYEWLFYSRLRFSSGVGRCVALRYKTEMK